jgi:proteic killer suppression protein
VLIRNVRHGGLRRFLEDDDDRGLPRDLVRRLRNILAALDAARDVGNVIGPPGWRIHQLRGDREGTWSISVSGNWRLTFDVEDDEVFDLDLEDYH